LAEGMAAAPGESYGNYILRTGGGITGQLELLLGAYWYQSRFAGKAPVLDLGPGRCWFTRQKTNDIVAVDNAPDLVEHFRQEGINILQGDAYKIPAPEEYFEGIFCCWLLEHLHEPDRAMREMRRVLKPGGYACVIVPTPHDMEAFYADYTHVRAFTKISLKQLAEDAGFIRYKSEFLPQMTGLSRVLAHTGLRPAHAYLRFADRFLRKVGLVNRNHLMLEVWK
jgi:SAM-dependent methyltransferase